MSQLNRQLPAELRIEEERASRHDNTNPASSLNLKKVEKIFSLARGDGNTEVLLWLVENGYRRTAAWLMEAVLNLSSSRKKTPPLTAPSNIAWPDGLFEIVPKSPFKSTPRFRPTTDSVDSESQFRSAHFDNREAEVEARLLGRVWETLGILIVNSAHASTDDTMDDNMLTALLVLAHVHNLGMVPDNIYAYSHMDRPTYIQRPPILNLVSSRILAALSDVTWRQQQDDAISQATRMGVSLKEISKNVPGGRFRLKVKPLAPEIWLELILWCCIESDQIAPALSIVRKLANQVDDPWFAVRWTSPQSRERLSTLVDWNRVKLRHGGAAGLIEGYSREKPFVDVPDKTISVEVILALIDKLLSSVMPSSLTSLSKTRAERINKDSRPLRRIMSDIYDVMTFLEPHNIDVDYFDYLESRLLQEGAFDLPRAPADLYTWTKRMASLRALEKIAPEKPATETLLLGDIRAQSQLHVGIQHQALNVLIEFGDIHNTLAIFNEIQESIDEKKVASIKTFLQQQQPETLVTNEITSPSAKHDLEFTNCHGQLPYYKLAGLLNLISDTNLVGLGRWLLYAEEVDGAALPEDIWGLPCMTAALYKFAAVSEDQELLDVASRKRSRKLLPSIKTLRTLANAEIALLHFNRARASLESLRSAQGGGFGLSNVVNLAATILRLERDRSREPSFSPFSQRIATDLLTDILVSARYNSTRGDFTLDTQRLFKQQLHHTLAVISCFGKFDLTKFAQKHVVRYPSSNLPLLPAKHFNVLLSAGIDVYGAEFGLRMWQKFCENPSSPYAVELFDEDPESLQKAVASDGSDESDVLNESNAIRSFGVPLSQPSEESQQVELMEVDEDIIEFNDPFFPKTPPIEEGIEATLSDEETTTSIPLQTAAPETARSDDVPTSPLVIPNLNTLRLIVRGTAREMKERQEAYAPTTISTHHRGQLAWAVGMFKDFGIVDPTVVEQEIQYPLSELDSSIKEETEKRFELDRRRSTQSMAATQGMGEESGVSEMWTPISKPLPTFLNYG